MPRGQKAPAKYTKQGNYLLRSKHSHQLIEFAILIKAGRVRRNGKGVGAQIVKKDGTWAGNAHWEMLMFVNRGLAEDVPGANRVRLTDLGEELLFAARYCTPPISEETLLIKIDSREVS